MNEQTLRGLIAAVKAGRISRRSFTRRVAGLGLTTPFATQLLAHAGLAQSSTPVYYKPTRAGGGALRTLFWQAPTLLNPHFAVGAKDAEGAGIFFEPLAVWDPERRPGSGARCGDPEYRERAGGDCHGGLRQRLHDDDGLPAQGRVFLLLARRKEGVEIEEQPLHRVFGR